MDIRPLHLVGEMPNSDISDAIVATGREILSKSIQLIDDGNDGAKVDLW